MKILIYGVGKMGSFFKDFFIQRQYFVKGFDVDPSKNEVEDISDFDVIFVCTPMGQIKKALEHIKKDTRKNPLLVDVASVKGFSVPLFKESGFDFLSVHPLFGDEANVSLSHLIIVEESQREEAWQIIEEFKKEGALITKLSCEEHDKQMAKIQGISHFLLLCFASVYEDMGFSTRIYKALAKLAARVLKENWEMYHLIQKNAEEHRKQFVEKILEFNKAFEDKTMFEKIFLDLRNKLNDSAFSGLMLELSKLNEDYSNLQEMRYAISVIDEVILRLIEKRVEIAKKIAIKKMELQETIENTEVEEEKLAKIARKTKLNSWEVEKIFRQIMDVTKAEEYSLFGIKKTIALIGPKGSFSDEVAVKLVGSRLPLKYYTNVEEVMKAVENKEADYGIVPIENTIGGTVIPTLDALMLHDVEVFGETKLEVNHCLVAKKPIDFKNIKYIYSHPQAVSQCMNFITNYLPHAEIRYTSSTSDAAKVLDDFSAAIMSENAAKLNKLQVLRKGIQDLQERNITRFYLIRKRTGNTVGKITSLFFAVENKPGALKKVLDIFYAKGFNLRKLESRPSKILPGDYVFFTEVEANLSDEDIKELRQLTTFYRIVGRFDEISKLDAFSLEG
ncbi:prephenate dehydratase [Pseudothermotoga thermarum]|uniref:Prephenate dehydrogenase n=1 Tax=Pseudothermotoga thermarum DSM 5069 TaxID=688269 RepID=F7YWY7_9THEM|nr:prephenate dehydratase [Pseudothermotoga thermarum]AEH50579.1 prephenate dehydratase [Pseudothermotoga thermarum DSM 5069]